MERVQDKFIRYIKVNTISDPASYETPSTKIQFDLAYILKQELEYLGVSDVSCDEHGYVMGKIPSNSTKKIPAIGFLAHIDTSPDFSGEDINPQIIENYDGKDIKLGDGIVMSADYFKNLANYIGQTLITTDGTTLLGADDKAGIAEIMCAVEYILAHPEIEHGDICIGFNPDEEIGRGVVKFDVNRFGAEFAYTLDGGAIGGLEYENFNAASMKLTIEGRMVHPGDSKHKMINAGEVAIAFHTALPKLERPEYTTGYEGFYHLQGMDASVEKTVSQYIIRDHDDILFEKKKMYATQIVEELKYAYPEAVIQLEIANTYLNMKRQIKPVMHIIDLAKDAMMQIGITPVVKPIRGGTDGSNLSYMGLPCPNLFTGGHNAHGRFEYVVIESMEKATELIVEIIKTAAERA
ncbi:peptidase T [Erysipelotrichaceae bacterium]|nr:peptidase T [Erysipelotrichaceae bacterium]